MQPQQPPADGAPESAEPLRATASALGAPGPRAAADAAASDQTNTAATSDIPIPEGAGTDIAVVQFDPYTDKDANLAALRAQCLRAVDSGAKVVVAPEYSMFAVKRLDQRAVDAAEPLDGPWVSGLRALATESGAHVVAGVVESPAADDSVRIYNTLVAAGPDGEIATIYRKVHLYDAFGFRESEVVVPGPIADPATFIVDGVVLGLQTCFDLRFPEGFRRVAAAGAHVLVVPAQWIPGPGKRDQWTTLLRARAIENTVYVAAADQATPRGSGGSMIIDPAGAVLAELGDEPDIATGRVELDRLRKVRATNPSLQLRRFDIR